MRKWSLFLAAVAVSLGVGVAGATEQEGVASARSAPAEAGRSAVFGGGPLYDGGQQEMDVLRSSGFNTVILWSIHVETNGDLFFNDKKIVSGGQYVGTNTQWSEQLRSLKQQPTSVDRIEVSVGSAGVEDWEHIQKLINSPEGTEVLKTNFRKLREVTGADAINNDDESAYDVDSTVRFGQLAKEVGFEHFTLAPYTEVEYWKGVKDGLGSMVDRVYLQAYAGGEGNDPAQWSADLGMPVDPGLWSKNGDDCANGDSPSDVRREMSAWRQSANIPGGFMWLYDDIKKCSKPGQTAKDYAQAINEATKPK